MDTTLKQQIITEWTAGLTLEQQIIRLFEKVRDLPYGDIGSREAEEVYRRRQGTCSGKHELLKELYQAIGVEVKNCVILHRFIEMPIDYPLEIKAILARQDIIDPHNFLKIKVKEKWVIVDATWDKPLQKLGFLVNENWDGQTDMKIAVVPGGEIRETNDPLTLKKELLSQLPEAVQTDRLLFLRKLNAWINDFRV